jgi:hypothetical protein
MITDRRAAELCAALYGYADAPYVHFEHIDHGEDDGICWALAREGDTDVVIFRGTDNIEDAIRDILAVAWTPCSEQRLGPVHIGFFFGLDRVWGEMQPMLRPGAPVCIDGHSLGAARASDMAGIMVAAGRPPARRVIFGEPRPGFAQLADLIKDVPTTSYRNGCGRNVDIVTTVPFSLGPLAYVNSALFTDVTVLPQPNDPWPGDAAYHHLQLYMRTLPA